MQSTQRRHGIHRTGSMALGVLELSLDGLDDGLTPEKLGVNRPSGHLSAGLVADVELGETRPEREQMRWTPPTHPFPPAF
ncbi:hypothetical protein CKAH01_06933 [Colletotrichum kahawae]|uniref:Uncharacterized protein n=1 Tax=Colletotrichum kahawae TaxID=34407 RepID=A0AAE0D387_COLKA|nr:hypothetical protein CKAH01_06933 [Colletotrichum kahawae]